ncbi:MAG: hypothetical protein WCP52_09405 [Bacteroidota bacterium]
MKKLLTILFLLTFGICNGQEHKIILGDTTYLNYYYELDNTSPYYNVKSQLNMDGTMYSLRKSLPDGHWLCYDSRDTTKLIIETNFKNGQINGKDVRYQYILSRPLGHIKNDSTYLLRVTESIYQNGNEIRRTEISTVRPYEKDINYYSLPKCILRNKDALIEDSIYRYYNDSFVQKCYFDDCDLKIGPWKDNIQFAPNGKLVREWIKKDGQEFQRIEYKNGELFQIEQYQDGRIIEVKEYSEGLLIEVRKYKDFKLIETIKK